MQRVDRQLIYFRQAEDLLDCWRKGGECFRSMQRAQRRLASDYPERLKANDEALIAERFRELGELRRLVCDGLN